MKKVLPICNRWPCISKHACGLSAPAFLHLQHRKATVAGQEGIARVSGDLTCRYSTFQCWISRYSVDADELMDDRVNPLLLAVDGGTINIPARATIQTHFRPIQPARDFGTGHPFRDGFDSLRHSVDPSQPPFQQARLSRPTSACVSVKKSAQ